MRECKEGRKTRQQRMLPVMTLTALGVTDSVALAKDTFRRTGPTISVVERTRACEALKIAHTVAHVLRHALR